MEAEAGRKAEAARRVPVALHLEHLRDEPSFRAYCKTLPNLGDYVSPAFKKVKPRLLMDYPYDAYFVDSLGAWEHTTPEPALSLREFRDALQALCARYDYWYYLGVCSTGEFQVHVGLYVRQSQ